MQIEQKITELQIKLSELKDGIDWLATAPCSNVAVAGSIRAMKLAAHRVELNLASVKLQLR